jgi:gentisate 1,2-dioxygenase
MGAQVEVTMAPETDYTRRALYYSSADGFNIKRPAVAARTYTAERDAVLDPAAATGVVALDQRAALGVDFAATTPLLLTRYARIRAGEKLATRFPASGEIYYVIAGHGETVIGAESIAWAVGDAFCLPGGLDAVHVARGEDCVLWIVTNEAALAFERALSPAPGAAAIAAVHYPAAEIRRQLDAIYRLPAEKTQTGKAVTLSQTALERDRTCLPSLTLAMNSLPPAESQRAHRHNAVAVTLVVQGSRCHSVVDGQRLAWDRHATMVTPPGASHAHHNEGDDLALFLIVQDGGLHYHTRTMGFAYTDS